MRAAAEVGGTELRALGLAFLAVEAWPDEVLLGGTLVRDPMP